MGLFLPSLTQATDNNGNAVDGAEWAFYLTGTSTPTNVYSDGALTSSLGDTVTADGSGWFVPIYLDDTITYRAVLSYPGGGVIGENDVDPVDVSPSNISKLLTIPPYNFAPNSQWEIMSGHSYDTAWNEPCTGTEIQISYDSNTTLSNTVVITRAAGFPSIGWKVGALIAVDTGDSALLQKPMRIQAITDTTLTVSCPFNLKPAATASGLMRIVTCGAADSVGSGDGADGWSKDTTVTIFRDDWPSNRVDDALYALTCVKGSGSTEKYYASLDLTKFAGRDVSFGLSARQRVKTGLGTWRVYIDCDGTGGGITTSSSSTSVAHNWKEVTATIPADATYANVGIELNGANGDAYCLCNPVVALGTFIGAYNYSKPYESFLPVVKVEPWVNAGVTFDAAPFVVGRGVSYPVDLFADSEGRIAPTVKAMYGNWEGINGNAELIGSTRSRTFGLWQRATDPTLIGFIAGQQVTDRKLYSHAQIFVDDGWCQATSYQESDSWYNISLDIDKFDLS